MSVTRSYRRNSKQTEQSLNDNPVHCAINFIALDMAKLDTNDNESVDIEWNLENLSKLIASEHKHDKRE